MRRILAAALLSGMLILAGCTTEAPTPEPTPTPSATLPPTATIEWFPATATPTLLPTQAPTATPDLPLGLGAELLRDDFSNAAAWQTGVTNAGNILLGEGTLNLAVQQPRSSLASLRSAPRLEDFYLQVTASPGLCSAGDHYGILFRAASAWDGYRLLVDCAGQVRLERIRNSGVVLVQDWTPLVGLKPLDFFHLRLGVWAAGSDFRIYANDILQFTARDPVYISGVAGVFARAGGETGVSVTFTDLVITEVDRGLIPPTPTLTPAP